MVKTIDRTMNIRTFHQKIAGRMAGAGLILALVSGGFSGWYQNRILMNEISQKAVLVMGQLDKHVAQVTQTPMWQEKSRLEQDLNAFFMDSEWSENLGQFRSVDIYNNNFERIASVIDPQSPPSEDLNNQKASASLALKANMTRQQDTCTFQGVRYIITATPIQVTGIGTMAYVETIFSVSPKVLSQARMAAYWSAAGVFIMILLTTVILFPVIMSLTHRMGNLALNLLHSNMETLEMLGSAISKRDSDTETHNYRVTLYAVSLAETVGLEPLKIQGLIKGAFLHDVGKIGVQDTILHKPGRLDSEEFETIKNQTRFGLDMVNRSQWLDDANQVVAYHHERYDGSGYFAGLVGDEIPMVARIFTIANVFDALTSKRPYKEPLSLDQTMEILHKDKGTHFDPELVDAFSGIAPALYQNFSCRDDHSLQNLLSVIRERYFRDHTVIH
ncbi:MAG: HD domain-containing protein [Proteobacteria bacterium]|nr:HD domain-containing protein [Pseudomonadota bacterium]